MRRLILMSSSNLRIPTHVFQPTQKWKQSNSRFNFRIYRVIRFQICLCHIAWVIYTSHSIYFEYMFSGPKWPFFEKVSGFKGQNDRSQKSTVLCQINRSSGEKWPFFWANLLFLWGQIDRSLGANWPFSKWPFWTKRERP